MDLYLIRHADALPLESAGIQSDHERPLSELGTRQALQLGQTFRAKGLVPEVIVSSPLVRARQTAAGFAGVLEIPEERICIREELLPGGRVRRLARFLNGVTEQSAVLVGHQPELSRHCAWLIGNKRAQLNFAKAGAALIHTEGMIQKGCGVLIWLITPDWLN
jgi:phosphohistidine phosphatase